MLTLFLLFIAATILTASALIYTKSFTTREWKIIAKFAALFTASAIIVIALAFTIVFLF